MGNQKFKLSDMIPNAWFFKLKDMSSKPPPKNPKKHRLPPPPPPPPPSSSPPSSTVETALEVEPQCHPRKSYHIARDPPISPPRKSKSRKHHSTRKNSTAAANHHHHHRQFSLSSSVSTTCTCRTTTTTTDDFLSPTITDEPQKPEELFDIVIDVSKSYGFDIELPRIATKPTATKPTRPSPNSKEHHQPKLISRSPPSRRFLMSSSSGVRLKVNSPKIMARKQGQNGNLSSGGRKSVGGSSRRSISESFAVVKSSRDPQKDFRESMVEMIVQNNLRASKDLEDLLACYLSLNSDEYHDVIIKVFKQIWFDLIHLRPHKQVVS